MKVEDLRPTRSTAETVRWEGADLLIADLINQFSKFKSPCLIATSSNEGAFQWQCVKMFRGCRGLMCFMINDTYFGNNWKIRKPMTISYDDLCCRPCTNIIVV